jgi:glycosyltransferase involved in cell wall biosynthesis
VISVALAPVLDGKWLGGLNYYRNLFSALAELNSPEFEFQLFVTPETDCNWLPDWPRVQIVRCESLRRGTLSDLTRRTLKYMTKRDPILERVLRRHKIEMLSHSGVLPDCRDIATAGWIPDLQHRHLPQLFSNRERQSRDDVIRSHLRYCDSIFVSSSTVRDDLRKFEPKSKTRVDILRFVAHVAHGDDLPSAEAVKSKYDLPERYFYLPNQFWVHKNHSVVVDAVKLLEKRGKPICVVCTGYSGDYRSPRYFDSLLSKISGHETNFRILGVVPSNLSAALMRDSVAIINPSLFEGWSTVVEEAKSLGKCILLSKIAVHREQAPGRGIFFEPSRAEELADHMLDVFERFDPVLEKYQQAQSLAELNTRQRKFAEEYLDILRGVLKAEK